MFAHVHARVCVCAQKDQQHFLAGHSVRLKFIQGQKSFLTIFRTRWWYWRWEPHCTKLRKPLFPLGHLENINFDPLTFQETLEGFGPAVPGKLRGSQKSALRSQVRAGERLLLLFIYLCRRSCFGFTAKVWSVRGRKCRDINAVQVAIFTLLFLPLWDRTTWLKRTFPPSGFLSEGSREKGRVEKQEQVRAHFRVGIRCSERSKRRKIIKPETSSGGSGDGCAMTRDKTVVCG